MGKRGDKEIFEEGARLRIHVGGGIALAHIPMLLLVRCATAGSKSRLIDQPHF